MGEPVLTFIVFACHMNVGPIPLKDMDFASGKQPGGCRVFEEEILTEEYMQAMTPMGCMMQSVVMVPKFQESHPGMEPRKWTCKYVIPHAKI